MFYNRVSAPGTCPRRPINADTLCKYSVLGWNIFGLNFQQASQQYGLGRKEEEEEEEGEEEEEEEEEEGGGRGQRCWSQG